MNLLAIETSHSRGSVAIQTSAGPRVKAFPPGLVHGRELLPAIDALVGEAGWKSSSLQAVAISNGPGSYTGVRIGVAAAKAIAYGLKLPVVSVSSLEAIAWGVPMESKRGLAVLVDARRGTLYGALFRPGRSGWERVTADELHPVSDFFARLDAETWLVGSGTRTVPGAEQFEREKEVYDQPDASSTLALGLRKLSNIADKQQPEPPEFGDPHLLAPVYLRPSEAEEKRIAAATDSPYRKGH